MPAEFKNFAGILHPPAGFDGKRNGTAEGDEPGKLQNDTTVCEVYRVPWEKNGHLSNADDDILDAAWAMPDGRRAIRMMKDLPDIPKRGGK